MIRGRVDGARAGGAVAAAQVVKADDEEAICIDGLSRADDFLPPAVVELRFPEGIGGGVLGIIPREVVGAREGVEDEDGIGFILI